MMVFKEDQGLSCFELYCMSLSFFENGVKNYGSRPGSITAGYMSP